MDHKSDTPDSRVDLNQLDRVVAVLREALS